MVTIGTAEDSGGVMPGGYHDPRRASRALLFARREIAQVLEIPADQGAMFLLVERGANQARGGRHDQVGRLLPDLAYRSELLPLEVGRELPPLLLGLAMGARQDVGSHL